MQLVIAEKPSVAMALSKVLGAKSRGDGYMEGGGWLVRERESAESGERS